MQQAVELANDYTQARGQQWPIQVESPSIPTAPKPERDPAPRPLVQDEVRSQTNRQGERRCFHCGTFGHLLHYCPERKPPVISGTSKALMIMTCREMSGAAAGYGQGALQGMPHVGPPGFERSGIQVSPGINRLSPGEQASEGEVSAHRGRDLPLCRPNG